VEKYIVKLCVQPAGVPCVTQECPAIECPFKNLTPGATYEVSAVAVLADGTTVPASNTLPLKMPAPGAITLVEAYDTSSTTGSALAVPPANTTITKVGGQLASAAGSKPEVGFLVWPSTVTVCGASLLSIRPTFSSAHSVPSLEPLPHLPACLPVCLPACLQYTFTVEPLGGGAALTFESTTPSVNFTGLTPATQVGKLARGRHGSCWICCQTAMFCVACSIACVVFS